VERLIREQSRPAAPEKTEEPDRDGEAQQALAVSEDGRAALEERVRVSRRRQTIARRLVESQQTAAMLTTFNEVDMSAVMELRKRRKESFQERTGTRLGFMSFFTKAAIGALKAFCRGASLSSRSTTTSAWPSPRTRGSSSPSSATPTTRTSRRSNRA
jgi:2-oxoglutarate dehydrogenase E2 component (dihydrolipoamide succinyltransferase)